MAKNFLGLLFILELYTEFTSFYKTKIAAAI
jgi:hypothetical protein